MTGPELALPAWRIVAANRDGTAYDLAGCRHWDLTAFDVDDEWHPILEVQLVKDGKPEALI